ncbi:hypothetical protein PENSPDRAFT_749641 [Peniophora sp. CONT]|nr:hypothetical protein PENSPDRAFT_749641 [Peniophora sp. CONT]
MAAVHYIPTVLLGSVVVLYCPSSEVLWIVGKLLLLLVLLDSVSREKLAEMASTSPERAAEPVTRVLEGNPRTVVASVAASTTGILDHVSQHSRRSIR